LVISEKLVCGDTANTATTKFSGSFTLWLPMLALWRFGLADLSEWLVCRGKASTATTAFARSRLPRSLLIAHSAAVAAGFGHFK
jgi:hypothetical protein